MSSLNGVYVTFTIEQDNNSFADFGMVDLVVTINGVSVSHDVIPENFKWTRTEGIDTPTESAMLVNITDGDVPFTTLTEGALVVHNISTTAGMQALDDGRNYVYFEGSLDLFGAVYGSTTNVLPVESSTALDAFYDNTLLHIDFSKSTVMDSSPFARTFVENTMGTTTINGLSAGQTNDGSYHILIDGVGDSDLTSWDFTCILVLELGETLGSYDSYFLWQWRVGWSVKDNMFKLGGGTNLRDRNAATSPDWRFTGNQVILVAKHNQTTMTYTIYDLQDGSVYGSTSGTVTPEMITYIQNYTFGYPTTSGREVLIGAGFKHDSLGYVEGSNSKYGEVIFINQYVENDAELNIVSELRTKWVPSTETTNTATTMVSTGALVMYDALQTDAVDGTVLKDYSGNGRDATITGGLNVVDDGFVFTGDNHVYLSGIGNPSGDWPHTISIWMNTDDWPIPQTSTQQRQDPFYIGTNNTGKGSAIDLKNSDMYWYFYAVDGGHFVNPSITANTWFHLCLVYDSSNTKYFYINGELKFQVSSSANNLDSNTPLWLGLDGPRNTSKWNGKIRQFGVYDRVFTAQEVMQNYTAGILDQVTAPTGSTLTVFDVPVEQRSFSDSHHEPGLQNSTLDYTKGWAAANPGTGSWIQMDLGQNTIISGVITKGRNDAPQWVTQIKVETSVDDTVWDLVLADVPANTDSTTQVTNEFPALVNARYVRITVMGFYGHPAMRAAVLGYAS